MTHHTLHSAFKNWWKLRKLCKLCTLPAVTCCAEVSSQQLDLMILDSTFTGKSWQIHIVVTAILNFTMFTSSMDASIYSKKKSTEYPMAIAIGFGDLENLEGVRKKIYTTSYFLHQVCQGEDFGMSNL